jgi:hypothetical protein
MQGWSIRGRLQANLGNNGDIHLPILTPYKSTTLRDCMYSKAISLKYYKIFASLQWQTFKR